MTYRKVLPWSYSLIEAYELCPKKVYHERVAKDVKSTRTSVGNYGDDAHKSFERRLLKGEKLPLHLRQHEKMLSKIESIPGEKYPEQKLAINENFEPTGFFDADVYGRGIIDYGVLGNSYMFIFDWKFGKQKEGFDQLELMAALMSCYEPDVEEFIGAYYWAKTKNLVSKRIKREQLPAIWDKFLPRIQDIQRAYQGENFPARPNFLCQNYCPVTQCQFHGERQNG